MDIGGATLAAAAMRAGLIDEYVLATAPVLLGSGTPFFTALDNWGPDHADPPHPRVPSRPRRTDRVSSPPSRQILTGDTGCNRCNQH